jgi:ketosteroid isomerase-like protein
LKNKQNVPLRTHGILRPQKRNQSGVDIVGSGEVVVQHQDNMHLIVSVAFFLTAGLTIAYHVVPASFASDSTEKQVEALITDWATARVDGDVAFLERFYGAEMNINGADGSVISRSDDIALFAAGKIKPAYIRNEDVATRVYGDVAMVTGVERLEGTYNGVAGKGALRFTHVLVKRDGRWQLVGSQTTWIKGK